MKSWILALRPKTMTAALVPVIVATALVKAHGLPVIWWISICAAASACFIQIGTNLVNDALDFHKGADTSERIGPQRVTQSGLLTSKQVMIGAGICFLAATALGVPLVMHGGWPIVVIGLVSIALAYGYTGGPYPLAYKGLGELFVVLFFGLVAVGGTFYLHAGFVDIDSLIAGLQVGFLATVLIAINNMRDAPQDKGVDKRTLAVRFGLNFARIEIAVFVISPFLLGFYWAHAHFAAAVFPFLAFPLARRVLQGVTTNEPSSLFNKFLALAAGLQMVFGLGLAVGLWLR
jgi:1,4-dihydroxy-2-naphthoate octaprenyltransferase